MLSPSVRSDLAPMMCRFLKTDYEWNWRFRQNFCEQLAESLHLFTPLDMYHHIHEVCLSLLMDRISSVRQSALSLVTTTRLFYSYLKIDLSPKLFIYF